MYYKIQNKECEVYQKLHELRTKELRMEEQNKQSIVDKVGLEWGTFWGYQGQQQIRRTTTYLGFQFKEREKVDLKIWKQSKVRSDIYEPNRKLLAGKAMFIFLNNLQKSDVHDVFDILKLDYIGRFTIPYIEIFGELVLIYLDDNHNPVDENMIEITRKEFYAISETEVVD